MNKLLSLILILPLFLKAEEVISPAYIPVEPFQKYSTHLNLKYELEFDYHFCDNNADLCKRIQDDKLLPKFKIQEKASNYAWATFWTLQLLDVYSTKKGLAYDCVKELNPLLPERPSTAHIILHKAVVFGIPYINNNWKDTATDSELLTASLVTGVVVINNFDVVEGARNNCNKIR